VPAVVAGHVDVIGGRPVVSGAAVDQRLLVDDLPVADLVAALRPSRRGSTRRGERKSTADYTAANGSGLHGRRATVTLAAQGSASSTDWRLTITLSRSTLQIGAVSGAAAERNGAVSTFTPAESTRQIVAGASVVIAFDIRCATLVDAQPPTAASTTRPAPGCPVTIINIDI
jgi:hypothetical protein